MEAQMCLDCLQRRIRSDFSHNLIFSYGISYSALPFSSCAVVQMSTSEEASAQFLLVYLPSTEDDCFTRYINEHVAEDVDGDSDFGTENLNRNHVTDEESSGSGRNESRLSLNGKTTKSRSRFCPVESPCNYSIRFSCSRIITAMAPCAYIGNCSYTEFESLASNLLSGSLEDDTLCSLSFLIEGKATSRVCKNFLSLIGIPSFDDEYIPGCLRHPNLAPLLGMLKSPRDTCLVFPKARYTLENILHYSPEALNSELLVKFLIYQILSAIAYIHGLGVAHGNICTSSISLGNSWWAWLSICDRPHSESKVASKDKDSPVSSLVDTSCSATDCPSQSLYADLKLSPLVDWHTDFYKWWKGELSNFEYLLILNRLAGRRWGDHTFHTVMPWVIDFSVKPDENSEIGWRDLSKSKWRLAKGDEQLDFTYSTSEIPHHVSDECLSELAVCSYKARMLPLSVLRMAVRSVYEPNEYPSSMQRLYQWTPDECIPEFYCDPQIFFSVHSSMSDLAVPSWAGSPQEFVKLHRDALESDRVSRQIHHWIDITFGYKMSGEAAVAAKNVMLTSPQPTMPRSVGRCQLFTRPHPARLGTNKNIPVGGTLISELPTNKTQTEIAVLCETDNLERLEEAAAFCEHSWNLSPVYCCKADNVETSSAYEPEPQSQNSKDFVIKGLQNSCSSSMPRNFDSSNLLDYLQGDENPSGYQELLLWHQKSSSPGRLTEKLAKDIFSLGCIIAELYLGRPLFDSTSLSVYLDDGSLSGLVKELPPHVRFVVEACIQKDWRRRPSAKNLLESPFFPATVRSSYLFVAPLQLLAKDGTRLSYAANFAKKGALREMGPVAAEMCATYCISLAQNPLSDAETEWAYILLREFLKSLKPKAVKTLVFPAIQKILQGTGYSHLKVALLQDSFVHEIWNHVGKQAYLEKIHPLVISNLYISAHKNAAAAASVLLIGSSEELGIPISVHQTVLPLIYCFGKGLSPDGIDTLIRIGAVLGENFVVAQILPLLKNVVRSCINASYLTKPEPVHSWSSLALVDCLMTFDGLITLLPREVVVKELINDQQCLFVAILMQRNLDVPVLQAAANTLLAVCQQIGPNLTAQHVLPQLKELFNELAFSQESSGCVGSLGRSFKIPKPKSEEEPQIENRTDLVLVLYPSFASILGIERLRQCCATWLLLEQYLLRKHNWKWEFTGGSSRSSPQNINAKRPICTKSPTSVHNPTKLLMHGIGWSIPQSQGYKGSKNLVLHKRFYDLHQNPGEGHSGTSNIGKCEPWFWFPSPAASWDGPDFLGRAANLKDELPWKIRASAIYSVRAHHGAVRSLAFGQDESTVYSAGVGPGFKGAVQRWDLSSVDCVSGYYGHEEVVNDICVLPSGGRVASCDGTIHIWNSQTGKVISIIAESSESFQQPTNSLSSTLKANHDEASMLNSNPLSSGILTSGFDGSLYTCMHFLESSELLVGGTGNGSLRFIDATRAEKLHIWRNDLVDCGFPSLVSAICSYGSDNMEPYGRSSVPSWIAAGLSSGNCRLLDARSGSIVASWRAHDAYVTKLAAPEDHLLVSSSLDRSLRIWDLRKGFPPTSTVFKGHSDGISDFAAWGQDVISISRNRIGVSSLAGNPDEEGQQRVVCQALYTADRGTRNMSVLSRIGILPFSRLFIVGTEDGHLKICC